MEITLPGADQFVGLILNFALMQFSKKELTKTDMAVKFIRFAFVISVSLQLLICFYIKRRIAFFNHQKKFKYKPTSSMLSVSEAQDSEIEITFAEYDNNEATSMMRGLVFQSILYMFVAWKFGRNESLIGTSFNLLKNFVFSPLYRAYLFGCHIERPYEKNLLFSSCTQETPVKVEKKKKKEE